MSADEFAAAIAALAPSVAELEAKGLSPQSAENFRKSYQCARRADPPVPGNDNPLLDLLARYDCSRLEIAVVTLGPAGISKGYSDKLLSQGKRVIGAVEADPLVLDDKTGEIDLRDHSDPNFSMAKVAANGAKLLDALYLVASFRRPHRGNRQNLSREQGMENYRAASAQAQRATQAAGILEADGGIYATLLGAWEPGG